MDVVVLHVNLVHAQMSLVQSIVVILDVTVQTVLVRGGVSRLTVIVDAADVLAEDLGPGHVIRPGTVREVAQALDVDAQNGRNNSTVKTLLANVWTVNVVYIFHVAAVCPNAHVLGGAIVRVNAES